MERKLSGETLHNDTVTMTFEVNLKACIVIKNQLCHIRISRIFPLSNKTLSDTEVLIKSSNAV